VRELVAGHPTLLLVVEALLAARAALGEQLSKLEKRVRSLARHDRRVRRLMSAPGVGAIVALTFVAAIDDPARFQSSKAVGAHFGLTPKKYQSGETDVIGRISKIGDAGVRTMPYEAANVILTQTSEGITAEELGDAAGASRWDAQGKGGIGTQASGCSASDAGGDTEFLADKAATAAT
jgi:transposase